MSRILVTGGLGYIGSHTVVALVENGFEPVIIDNLSNSDLQVLERLKEITGKTLSFIEVEMCEKEALEAVFKQQGPFAGVIHFAAFLQVQESVAQPLKYYYNNMVSTINLLEVMEHHGVPFLVFSSSCTVYGNPDQLPVSETAPVKPAVSPYGNTKKLCEDIIRDAAMAGTSNSISLRYFNPIGAHNSALIGEVQQGEPHHLIPYITETATGKRKVLKVFGNDYNTSDGSCVRDYIHVMDIAGAHVDAVKRQIHGRMEAPFEVYNLGTGEGYSVLQMIKSFEKATGIPIPHEIAPRRDGDVEAVYADTRKAEKHLGWKARHTLEEMLRSAWVWEQAQTTKIK